MDRKYYYDSYVCSVLIQHTPFDRPQSKKSIFVLSPFIPPNAMRKRFSVSKPIVYMYINVAQIFSSAPFFAGGRKKSNFFSG